MLAAIDEQLVQIYAPIHGIIETRNRSATYLGIDFASMPVAQVQCLWIWACAAPDTTLTSIVRRSWVVDADGVRVGSPAPPEMLVDAEWIATHPYLRFAHDGHSVCYGLTLGAAWYWKLSGRLEADPKGGLWIVGLEEGYRSAATRACVAG